MMPSDPYNDEVRARFANPVHAGDLQGSYPETRAADMAESAHGARIVLFAGLDDGKIAALRFRAWGCPHLVAAAELYCSDKEGQEIKELSRLDVNEYMDRLSVPIEKTGRILLLESAAKSLAARAD